MTAATSPEMAELAALLEAGERRDGESDALRLARELLDLGEGVHEHVPEAVYHAKVLGVASKSALDLVLRSPARYLAWAEGHERREAPALHLGRAVHCARLEPERFAATYVIEPDFGDLRAIQGRTTKEQGKANKDARDAWRREHPGSILLSPVDGAATLGMICSVAAHPEAGPLFEGGVPEVTLVWRCPATGLLCKARADYWIPDLRLAIDLKSTLDAREPAFARSIETYGYHRQEAHYRQGFEVLDCPIDDFVFVPVEKEPPYDLRIWTLDREDLEEGRDEIFAAKRRLSECVAVGTFPGYARGIHTISRPPWARRRTA